MRNLIYFTIDNKKDYLNLAKVCVQSLLNTNYKGDILFITRDFQEELSVIFSEIKERLFFLNPRHDLINIENGNNFIKTDNSRIFSSANKLKIFEFKNIVNYEKVIYSDLDILWLKSPDDLFNCIDDKNISLSEENDLMSRDYYSANLASQDDLNIINNKNIKGCSGGIFGFNAKNVNIIQQVYDYFLNNLDKVEGLFEQPFINIYLFKNQLYNSNFTRYVDHNGYYNTSCKKHVLHFAGGPGEFDLKFLKIKNYINSNTINNKIDIIYRCCEAEVQPPFKRIRPQWFNKLKCLESFLIAIKEAKDVIGEVIFLHDGRRGSLYDAIPKNYKIECVDCKSNETSLLKTFDIADSLQGNYIYFVEDDYLHLKHSIKTIYNGTQQFQIVNGYDHLDRYIRDDDVTRDKESISFLQSTNCHWRTAESTCCTWAATRQMWNIIRDSARHYRLRDRDFFRNLYKNNIRLWTPIPGVTTQVDDKLSPGVNWLNVIE